MSFNQILDIAVVLIGVYAALSCVCSWVHEKIAKFLELRGWNLFRGVLHLTSDHNLAADIFNHPLVATTSPDPTKLVPVKEPGGTMTLAQQFNSVRDTKPPSYLDARNFSSAFWNVLLSKADSAVITKATGVTVDGQGQSIGGDTSSTSRTSS